MMVSRSFLSKITNTAFDFRRLCFLIIILSFNSCRTSNVSFNHFKETLSPISCIYKKANESVILDNESCSYILVHTNKTIFIVDARKNEIIDTIIPPPSVKTFKNISFPALGYFAICQDNGFWVYKNSDFTFHPFSVEKDSSYIFIGTRIQYFNKYDKIAVQTMPANAKNYDKDLYYSWNTFRVYDLKKDISKSINVIPDKKYWGMKLDIPYIYTSQIENSILGISFGYDEKVYAYDVVKEKLSYKTLTYSGDNLEPIKTSHLKKAEAKDAMQLSWTIDDCYYSSFYNPKNERVSYRIYKPGLPKTNRRGEHLGYLDKPTIIIKNDLSNNTKYYKLPSGVFLIPNDWYYNVTDDKLYFVKSIRISQSEDFQIFIYAIDLLDF